MDNHNRLPISQPLQNCLPDLDAVLAMVAVIWWPRVHRGVKDQANSVSSQVWTLKCILGQKQKRKTPEVNEQNEDV